MPSVITSIDQLNFSVEELPDMPSPTRVLMVKPTHFTVDYVINPHMAHNVGRVDTMEAQNEWRLIRNIFSQIGVEPQVLDGQEGLPDMVFCANQSLPFIDGEERKQVVMSIMKTEQRKKEVPYIEQWYRQAGYEIHFLDEDKIKAFEGCGDAIWHRGKQLLWGGYGFRSSFEAYSKVAALFDIPIIALELVDESFYHLDTCLAVLDKDTALIYPAAFTEEGLALINAVFDIVLHATEYEANELFACNATCPDGHNVIIQHGCTDTAKKLRDAGFAVHEVKTDEFLKSGGSVFCMKQLVW